MTPFSGRWVLRYGPTFSRKMAVQLVFTSSQCLPKVFFWSDYCCFSFENACFSCFFPSDSFFLVRLCFLSVTFCSFMTSTKDKRQTRPRSRCQQRGKACQPKERQRGDRRRSGLLFSLVFQSFPERPVCFCHTETFLVDEDDCLCVCKRRTGVGHVGSARPPRSSKGPLTVNA